ncbi:hypothetical protein [Brucella gallinifaecis]|uniref:hypothetical protein n=1 Tax=Brucella gallinifaecis TaxID=215590 RepID=UPI002362C240|nr:hypothetical protein [Brucella gallinifaecis]
MSKTLQTITPDHDEKDNYILKIVNAETSSEREYDRYETKDELDQAIEELKNDGSLSENEEIETEYVGPDVIIENLWISKQDGTGDLIITAEFQTFDSDGEETSNQSSDEYIDLDSGQIDTYEHGLMRSETQWSYFDVSSVQEAINDVLQENPIGSRILDIAREEAELRDAFDDCQLRSGSDKDTLAVVNTGVFASDEGVHVSFNVIKKDKDIDATYPTYVESSILYAQYDSETETFKFNEKYDAEISPLSEEIRNQLQEFRELPETQAAIEKATAEHLEKKKIQDIKNSIQNGEAEIIKFNVVEDNYKLATQATIIAKENDQIFNITAINHVDLETGKSLNTDDYRSYPFSSDMNDIINSKIDEYLQENPISEYEIERYKEDTANQEFLAAEFHSDQSDKNSNVAVSNLHIAINAHKEVIANFDVIERQPIKSNSQPYRYTEHVMMSEKVDLDTKSVVHKSQSSLDYGSYDHDQVRDAVSKKIQSDGLLSDRAVAAIKNKIGAASEDKDKDEDRVRMVAR